MILPVMDVARRDAAYYRGEASRSKGLTDRERVEQMRELYDLYLMFQRSKPAEKIAAEERADRLLNAWRVNPRYRALLLGAGRDPGTSADQEPD
jgi:hypothetical protein